MNVPIDFTMVCVCAAWFFVSVITFWEQKNAFDFQLQYFSVGKVNVVGAFRVKSKKFLVPTF